MSLCQSVSFVTEVRWWHIIPNLGFKFHPTLTRIGRRAAGRHRAACGRRAAGESSRAMLASDRVSCCLDGMEMI